MSNLAPRPIVYRVRNTRLPFGRLELRPVAVAAARRIRADRVMRAAVVVWLTAIAVLGALGVAVVLGCVR